MKKINLFLFAVMMPILFMVSCDSKPTVSNAAFRVQEVIQKDFSSNCKFDDGSLKGEEEYSNNFIVYQKFTAEKYGSTIHYIYKAKLEYKGGDIYEKANWDIQSILVENTDNGEQWQIVSHKDGTNIEIINPTHPRESSQKVSNKTKDGLVEGKDYRVIEMKYPNYIYIYTPKQLNKKDIIKIYNIFKDSYESIRFTFSMNPKDDDYFCFQYGYVYDFKKNRVYKLNDYLNNPNPKNLLD